MGRLQKILQRVRKNYPELAKKKIRIGYTKLEDCYGNIDYDEKYPDNYNIAIDATTLFKAPDQVLEGLIAHELGHGVLHLSFANKLFSHIDDLLYKFSLYGRIQERQADLLALQRGYGNQLIAYIQYLKDDKEFDGHTGLSIPAIQQYLQRLAA